MRKFTTIKTLLLFLGIILALSFVNYNLSLNPEIDKCSEYSKNVNLYNVDLKISKISDTIYIDGNFGWFNFKNAGYCTGLGTYSDPYVIEDLIIDGGGTESCIYIINSDVYFKIENCTLYNSGGAPNAGIILYYVNNSLLVNNNCSFNAYGIYLYHSGNNTILKNIVNYNEGYGICLYYSDDNIISENILKYNFRGIYSSDSNNNIISGNIANYNDNGIHLDFSNDNTLSSNIASNNSHGIHLFFSDNNIISGNMISNNSIGIYLEYANYNYVLKNILSGNEKNIEEFSCEGNIFKISNNLLKFVILMIVIPLTVISITTISFKVIKRYIKYKPKRERLTIQDFNGKILSKGKISDNKAIIVKDLKKFFGDIKAVNGISFDVHRGEVFGLLGPNGAGKTTTIRLLLGFLEPDQGEISILGLNPELDEVQIKKQVGYVSEEPLKFKALTPKDLINFIASIRDLDEKKTLKLMKDYFDSFEITEYYDQLIASLSHGNIQKLQVIVSILHEPDVLILDEPIAGLDAKSVKIVKSILKLHTQRGGSVLLSTHIMEIAQELCDRIGILHKGEMVGIGTMEELRQQADKVEAKLEDVFLRLTKQDASVDEIVEKLRARFKSQS
ncbi:MAG: NosD domain-containing protein [Promethearchaeota archaeon]